LILSASGELFRISLLATLAPHADIAAKGIPHSSRKNTPLASKSINPYASWSVLVSATAESFIAAGQRHAGE
jgi:hypothetical protein